MPIQINFDGKEIAKSVVDLFSPLTEFAGAIGDHIRVYRELSVLKTLQRARRIAEAEGLALTPPPLKFLVPFLEQSSLEDETNETLIKMWANLLVASATDHKAEHNIFIRVLNELSPAEAHLFKYIASSIIHQRYKGSNVYLEEVESDWDELYMYISLRDLLAEYGKLNKLRIDYADFHQRLLAQRQSPGSIIYYFSVSTGKKNEFPYDDVYTPPRDEFDDLFEPISISLLISLGLIGRFESPEYWFGNVVFDVRALYLTPLGARFFEACAKDRG